MRKVIFGLLFVLMSAPSSHAVVEIFGINPSVGAVGDGRLTAQVSLEGTIMCLRWPNATFYEHVRLKNGKWSDDPARNAWLQSHFGAGENEGIFAGLRYWQRSQLVVRWLREAQKAFHYATEDSNRLVATYTFDDGLVVEEQTYNVPDNPFLVRQYRLVATPLDVTSPALIAFANLALRNKHGEYAPNSDFEEDAQPRYATFALEGGQILLSALPKTLPPSAKTLEGSGADAVGAFVRQNMTAWGPGIYLAQGASVKPTAYQVGRDYRLRSDGPQDAYLDAQDGVLSGNSAVAEFETTALLLPLAADTTVAWYAAFATTAQGALEALALAQTKTPAEWASASDAWWQRWLRSAVLPSAEKARTFGKRALISLRTGMDPESGAIVASTSCQPPYNVDWPRDGAFFQFVLDMNGFEQEAEQHARFYPKIQYTQPGQGLHDKDKVGRFPMNAFADGVPGGPWDWEIDNTGFVLWLYRVHAGFLSQKNPAAAATFLRDIRSSTIMAADLLASCKDPTNGLQCRAQEDDHPEYTQTLHGAITTWLGLRSAAEMLEALGDQDRANLYRARVRELGTAIRANFDPAKAATSDPHALGWSYWPAAFWTQEEQETNRAAADRLLRHFYSGEYSLFDPASRGSAYSTKAAIALQVPPLRSDALLAEAEKINRFYLDTMMLQTTFHLAEFTHFYDTNGDGQKEIINVVATPHLWGQVLVYLSLIAYEQPERLVVPAIRAVTPESAAGCACRINADRASTLGNAALLLMTVGGLWAMSRYRANRSAKRPQRQPRLHGLR